MADRYHYLTSIGLAVMLSWGIPSLIKREELRKKILFPAAMAFLAILTFLTWQQCGYWKNSIELFKHALQVTKDNALAHNGFASALFDEGKTEEAIDHYNKSIQLNPYYVNTYYSRGITYDKLGQYQMAINDFSNAISLKSDYADAYNARGAIFLKFGQYQQAIEDFNRAIQLNPTDIRGYNNRGILYTNLGQPQMAIKDFSTAISLKDDYANAYNNRAFVYLNQGNIELGCYDAQKACALGNCTTFEAAKSKGLFR